MATMVVPSQSLPIERAVALVRERYGFEARITRLTGERDENFKLTAPDGTEYVLKVANPHEDPSVTDLLTAALLHLEESDPALPCPRVVRELAGGTHVRFAEGGLQRTARILTYLPGRLLGAAARSQSQRVACGRVGGRLSSGLRGFEHPGAHRAIIWDVRHAGHLWVLLGELPCFPYRAVTADLLTRIVPDIESRLPMLRQQVVHNDLNPLNILVEPADEARVTGVIDFGDLTHTALIADVAVAAAEMIPTDCTDSASALECVHDVASAYHECVPLTRPEQAMLGVLVAARLLLNVVVHEWHVHHNPSSSHFAALEPDFMRTRLEIADRMLREDLTP
jgi:hydroxylysine kinase